MVQRLFRRRGCREGRREYKYLKSLPFSLEHIPLLGTADPVPPPKPTSTKRIYMLDVSKMIPMMEDTDPNSM